MPPPQLRRLVAVERDVQRAGLEVSADPSRWPHSAPPRTRARSVRGQRRGEQPLLAPGRLADGGEHARCDARGARARLVALEDLDPQRRAARRARRRRARSRRLRRSRATSLRSSRLLRVTLPAIPPPALPGSGSDGRRPVAALSALGWAPVAPDGTPRYCLARYGSPRPSVSSACAKPASTSSAKAARAPATRSRCCERRSAAAWT